MVLFHLNRISVWKKYLFFYRKRNRAKNYFEIDFHKLVFTSFFGKMLKNVSNRLKIKLVLKKILKETQSKLTFSGIPFSYENCDSYTFEHNEVLRAKSIYVGFVFQNQASFICMRHIMINYNLILDRKNYNDFLRKVIVS